MQKITPLTKDQIVEMIKNASEFELRNVWIPAIMERQTWDEVAQSETREENGVGLNAFDAKSITSMFKRARAGYPLTDKQVETARKKLPRYAGQYAEISVENCERINNGVTA